MLKNFLESFVRKLKISKRIIKEEGVINFIKFIFVKIYYKNLKIFDNLKIKKLIVPFFEELKKHNNILIIISGMKFDETVGNRSTYLSKEFYKKNYLILYVYFTWNKSEETQFGFLKNIKIFLIPLRIFLNNYLYILSNINNKGKRILIIEAPFKECFEILSFANSFNFFTIYDIIDDWEEFNKVGQAIWYFKKFEDYLCNNSDLILTVSVGLYDKFNKYSPFLISNGFDVDAFNKNIPCKKIKKGKINIGYFGNLNSSWFDWDLIIKIAQKEKDWIFHIIGFGQPDILKLPMNIIIYGKVKHEELLSYANNWDVAIIPFKNSLLSQNSDPIKLYEYLYIGKPIIVQGIKNIDNYPYVYIAENLEEFIKLIKFAKEIKINKNILKKFLKDYTWTKKVEILENLIEERYLNQKIYLLLNKDIK